MNGAEMAKNMKVTTLSTLSKYHNVKPVNWAKHLKNNFSAVMAELDVGPFRNIVNIID